MREDAPESRGAPDFLQDRYQKLLGTYRQDWATYESLGHIRRHLTELCSEILNVERVGIWHYTPGRDAIACVDHFQRSTGVHTSGVTLYRKDYPAYFAAIDRDRIVSANNARTDSRTSEFAESYLKPNGIGAMLDAPVIMHGVTIGVFCNEHVGSARLWTPEEEQLARSITDISAFAETEWTASRSETELKNLERQLSDARRLEEVGLMTAKLAHDFNNLITPIKGWAEFATENPSPQDLATALKQIISGSERARDLVDSLLQFVRRTEPEKVPLEMSGLIFGLTEFLQRSLKPGIDLVVDLPPPPVSASGSGAQLQQVLVNLVRNAADAIGSRPGRIEISGRIIRGLSQPVPEVPADWITAEGPLLLLAVRDNGTGIPAEHLAKVFDPMFSTKANGNGLGLAAARKILKDHGGDIAVSSRVGTGTVFTLYLPVRG